MDSIYETIMAARNNLDELFSGIETKYFRDYYALFIAAMAYWDYIDIDSELAAKLHVTILNSDFKDIDQLLNKIYDYLIERRITDVTNEINDETIA